MNSLFEWKEEGDELETQETITPRKLRMAEKAREVKALKRQELAEFVEALPSPGETLRCVSNGRFDYWDFVPHILKMRKGAALEFYASTWTLNRQNCEELLQLFDSGRIRKISFMTGIYFKRRESAVYATLLDGLTDRGQRYIALENHSKIAMLAIPPDYYVLEGSANFTANPRIEQNCLTNSKRVFDFHKEWMNEVFAKVKK